MRQLLVNLVHHLGTGRALENARRECDEVAAAIAAVDALERRLTPGATVVPRAA